MRLVLDTNTVVSALLWRGKPHELVAAAQSLPVVFFTSPVLLAELTDVLNRTKLSGAVASSGLTPVELMLRYWNISTVIHPTSIPPTVLADPDDDHVLACAVSASANIIVSGDSDLLDLKSYQDIPILTAAEALQRISKR